MAVTAGQIIDSVTGALQDATNVRWPRSLLLSYLNDGLLEVLIYRPDACTAVQDLALAAGWLQTIPAGAVRLLDVKANTSGRACKLTKRDALDDQRPAWRADEASTTIKAWVYDERDAKRFEVWPPAASGASLKVVLTVPPTPLANEAASVPYDDIYRGPLMSYVMHRAYLRDSEDAAMGAQAASYYNLMVQQLSGKTSADLNMAPTNARSQRKDVTQ